MIVTLIVVMLLVILTPALLMAVDVNIKQSEIYDQKVQAYYHARSGVEVALDWLIKDGAIEEDFRNIYNGNAYITGDGNDFQMHFSKPENPSVFDVSIRDTVNGIVITSESLYGNTNESLNLTIVENMLPPQIGIPSFEMAVFVLGTNTNERVIDLNGSAKIEGHVGADVIHHDAINLAWSTGIYGDLFIGVDGISNDVVTQANSSGNIYGGSIKNLTEPAYFPIPIFPMFPEDLPVRADMSTDKSNVVYKISEDGYYNIIQATSNRTITIDLNNETRIIRVNNLDIQQGNIVLDNVGENGKLILYVNDAFNLLGSSKFNEDGNTKDIMLYYKGDKEPKFGGAGLFTGNLFSETTDITIGGSSGIAGNIITGGTSVKVTGAAALNTRILYAPNAKVTLSGSGALKGAIVADSFDAGGGTKVIYEQPDIHSLPAEIFPSDSDTNQTPSDLIKYHWQ